MLVVVSAATDRRPLTVAFPYSAADAASCVGVTRSPPPSLESGFDANPCAARRSLQLRSTPSSAGGDEAGGGNRGVEQDPEVGGGGGRGPPLPPQGVQPLRQAHLQVHGARRGRQLQRRRPGQ